MNRLISLLLSLVMVLSSSTTAFGIDTPNGTGEVPVELTQAVSEFSVTVPTVLPVDVDADGVVTVATDNKIINNSWGPVEVKEVLLVSQNGWTLVDFNTDFKTKQVGLQEYGFQLNETNVETDGSCAAEFAVIPGNSEIGFTYDANVAAQKQALEDVEISQVVFVIGWAKHSGIVDASYEPGLYDANGVMLASWEESGISVAGGSSPSSASIDNKKSFYYLTTKSNKYPTATQVVVPDTVTKIGDSAFYDCDNLTNIVIGDGVSEIGKSVFSDCDNLSNISIGAGVSQIDLYIVADCTFLKNIDVSPDNATYSSQNGIVFSKDATQLVLFPTGRGGSYSIPDTVTTICDAAFYMNHNLITVSIPNSVTTIGSRVFDNCTNLVSARLPDSVTSLGEETFWNCDSLSQDSFYIPVGLTKIPYGTFCHIDGSTPLEIVIPEGITSIGGAAFQQMSNVKSIVLPKSLVSIGSNAFYSNSIETVYYRGSQEEWKSINKYSTPSGTIVYDYQG